MVNFLSAGGGSLYRTPDVHRPGALVATESRPDPSIDRQQFEELSMSVFNQATESNVGVGTWEHVGRTLLGVGVDTVDTIFTGPLNPFADRGDVNRLLSPEQQAYYDRNKGIIEGGSAVIGGIATVAFAEALVIPKLASALARSTSLTSTRMWRYGAGFDIASKRAMLQAQRTAIEAGESFTKWGTSAGRKFAMQQAARESVRFTRTLPIDYLVMWENEAFNSGELGEELFWSSIPAVAGAGVGLARSSYVIRRAHSNQRSRDIYSAQLTQAGVTNALLDPSFVGMPTTRQNDTALDLSPSTELTMNLVASRANAQSGVDTPRELMKRESDLRAAAVNGASDAMERLLARQIEGVSTTRQRIKDMPEIQDLITQQASEDPLLMLGVNEFGLVETSFKQAMQDRQQAADGLYMASQLTPGPEGMAMAKRAGQMKRQEGFVYAGGTWLDPQDPVAAAMKAHDPARVKNRMTFAQDSVVIKAQNPASGDMTIDLTLRPMRGGRAIDPAHMDLADRFALIEGTNMLFARLRKTKGRFKVTDKNAANWFTLDMADEHVRRGGSIDFDPKGRIQNMDDLRRASLRQKANRLLTEKGTSGVITAEDRLRYNLPVPTAMERLDDPAGDAFRSWLGAALSNNGTTREMTTALDSVRNAHGLDLLRTEKQLDARVDGDIWNFNRTARDENGKGGQWMRPMLGFVEPRQNLPQMAGRAHEELLLMEKAAGLRILSDTTRNPHVSRLTTDLVSDPAFEIAHGVNKLSDQQSTGLGGAIWQALGEVLPRRHLHRDNPTVLAASRLHERAERAGRVAFAEDIEKFGIREVIDRLSTRAGAALRAELDQFATLRPGWSIDSTTQLGNGRTGFFLADDEVNRRLLGVDKVQPHTLMPNMRTNEPITLSDEALDVLGQFERMSNQVRKGDNQIRMSRGEAPVASRAFFMPSPQTKGRLIGFVQGPDGQILRGHGINAATPAEYAQQERRILDELGDDYIVRSREELDGTRDIWDEVGMDWIDQGVSTATAGIGRQTGGLTPYAVKDGAFLDAIDWAKDKYAVQSLDVLKTLMKHPLQTARLRSGVELAAKGMSPLSKGAKGEKAPIRSVFDEFEQALTGQSKGFQQTRILSRAFDAAEELTDRTMAIPMRHAVDFLRRNGVSLSEAVAKVRGRKTHAEILNALGQYSPYKTAEDYLEAQQIRRPTTTRTITQGLNKLATNLVLRWDPLASHATMNMLGMIPTLIAGTRAGSAATTLSLNAQGKKIPLIDGIAIIKGGIADMTDRKSHADWAEMVRNGDASQSALEYFQTIGAIKTQADWHKWAGKMDKWVGFVTDTSENWSRQIGHFTGLRLADAQGIKGAERHSFAREFANASIADYTPSNRPELFQTAYGSVFGLFQSYALNQLTKMFRWMEKGDYEAFGLQAATQATMFGTRGTYGAAAVFTVHDKFFQDSGEPSLLDTLYNRFGPALGNAIAHGGISEVSGVALWTRGDITPRLPIGGGAVPPAIDIMKRTAQMFTGSMEVLLNQSSQNMWPALVENIQREMPSRMLKGIMGQMMGGVETDRSGNVMHITEDWKESLIRVAGFRSSRQQVELEAFYSGRSDMERDAVRLTRVRNEFKTAVRTAERTGERVDPHEYFDKYVASGGNPRNYRTWVKQIMRDAPSPRTMAQLRKNLETPKNQLALWRYGAYGAWDIDG